MFGLAWRSCRLVVVKIKICSWASRADGTFCRDYRREMIITSMLQLTEDAADSVQANIVAQVNLKNRLQGTKCWMMLMAI